MLGMVLLYVALALRFGWRLEKLTTDWFDNLLNNISGKIGSVGLSVLIAALLLGTSLLYVRLDLECRYLGGWYALMANDPFNFSDASEVGFRRLTPTISYLIGLPGENIIITNLLIAGGLLFCVSRYFLLKSDRISDAFFAPAALALTLPVLTTIHCGGYTDATTYLIVFLIWWFRHRAAIVYPLVFIGLLNHDSVLFIIPWLAILRYRQVRSFRKWLPEVVLAFGATIAAYASYRDFITSHLEVRYSMYYYLSGFLDQPLGLFKQTFPFHGLGTFSVFKLLWIFPAMAFYSNWQEKRWLDALAMAALFLGAYLQLFVAADTSRMMTLCFMLMPVSLLCLWQGNRWHVRKWMGWVFLANMAVPTMYTAGRTIEIWQPLWRHLLIGRLG